MFNLEDLLKLFEDKKIKSILSYSYFLSQANNKVLSDSVFNQFLYLKKCNPSINIIYDSSKDSSFFSPTEETIYLNELSIGTFFHELTHLFSWYSSQFTIPFEYKSFISEFKQSPQNLSTLISFMNILSKKKKGIINQLLDEKARTDDNNNISLETDLDYLNHLQIQSTPLEIISQLEDIVDAIIDGKSYTDGLTYVKDNNSNALKSKKSAGHGCQYYSNSNYQFEEILAEYLSIKLLSPNNELFLLLKNILGDGFISIMDQKTDEICGTVSMRDMDIFKFDINKIFLKNQDSGERSEIGMNNEIIEKYFPKK